MAPVRDSFVNRSIRNLLTLVKNVSVSMPGIPSILYLLYAPLNAPSSCIGPQFNSARSASRLAIRRRLFLPFFAIRIFLFSSAILTFMRLSLDGGCHLRGAPLTGFLGTLINSILLSDSASCVVNLSASRFMVLIFFP